MNYFNFNIINILLPPCKMTSCSMKYCYEYVALTVILLEYLEGNRGVLNGNDDPTVVQVQDVVLLLENLQNK